MIAPLFCLRDLEYAYSGEAGILAGVDLDIFPGDHLALVGPNGSGKTTLARLMSGLLLPGKGTVSYKNRLLAGDHLEKSRLELGILFQDPDDQLFGHTVLDDVMFGPRNQGKSMKAAQVCAMEALRQVNLEELACKEPHHLSYGQKKRAALAGILAMNPAVLILDEPTANLDSGQEAVFMDLITAFTGTLICISHDLIFLYELCKTAVVLHQGRIRYHYTMDDLVSHSRSLRGHGLDFSFRLKAARSAGHEIAGDTVADAPPAIIGNVASRTPLIRLENFGYVYPDGTRGLRDLSLDIHVGERVAIVGENGAGKSTLLSCLVGLRRGQQGIYRFNEITVTPRVCRTLWRKAGMVFQDCADQLFCASVSEEVAFGLRWLGISKSSRRDRVATALDLVGLAGYEDRVPLYLSGGERRRLALACVIAMDPDLLILDEPTAGLDPRGEELLLNLLEDFDKTVLLVSHDLFFVERLTRRTLVMHQGRMINDLVTRVFMQDEALSGLNGLSFSCRHRTTDTIRRLQHEHEHRRLHRHSHDHEHEHHHGGMVHAHLHEHLHEHTHRFVHEHPGGRKHHEHTRSFLHDHDHSGHAAADHDHCHE